TFETDNLVGAVPHLAHRDVTFILASRSPLATLNEYKRRFGWDIEWVCMGDNGFNDDFFEIMRVDSAKRANVQTLRGQGLVPENYEQSAGSMLDVMELMALSCFAPDEGTVYHAYSTYDRGTDALNATWQLLDRAPRGRGTTFDNWPRKRDEY
ncbi:MAG: DUF899 family protein, partial [Nocardia sp.]|nr:DUF899 family protein [Nocardia sp.]